jgi:hypothetical protein
VGGAADRCAARGAHQSEHGGWGRRGDSGRGGSRRSDRRCLRQSGRRRSDRRRDRTRGRRSNRRRRGSLVRMGRAAAIRQRLSAMHVCEREPDSRREAGDSARASNAASTAAPTRVHPASTSSPAAAGAITGRGPHIFGCPRSSSFRPTETLFVHGGTIPPPRPRVDGSRRACRREPTMTFGRRVRLGARCAVVGPGFSLEQPRTAWYSPNGLVQAVAHGKLRRERGG